MATLPHTSAVESKSDLIRGLSLLDCILLLVSGIIGSSIFLTAKDIAGPLPHPLLFLGVWILGGLISLCACFAFAELGAIFPDSGGQYVYMREAYGDLVGFLYGWMIFTVSNGGTIAALSMASASYLGAVFPALSADHVVFRIAAFSVLRIHVASFALTRVDLAALVSIAVVTWVNVVGLRAGAVLQNVATWAKFAAMAAFIFLGFTIGKGSWSHFTSAGSGTSAGLMVGLSAGQLISAFGVALIAVFWAYDGWIYITWVSGEVKDPQRNIPRGLLLGVIVVGIIYVAMNMTYIYALPITEIAKHETIAHAAAAALFSAATATWLSALIAVSCFGAMASCALSGARVYYAMAKDGAFFPKMGEVHPRWHTPAFSLIGQGLWAGVLTLSGRYDQLYTYVMFMMVLSYTLGVGLPVHPALEATQRGTPLQMHRVSVAASAVYPYWNGVDREHHRSAPGGIFGGHDHCAGGSTGISLLETNYAKDCGLRALFPLKDFPIFHHKLNVLEHPNILQRVPRHGDDIGIFPSLD
jgi:APA family basic amino acid/polyamine antiporter